MTEVPLSAVAVLPAPSPVCSGDMDSLCTLISGAQAGAFDCQGHAASAERALLDARGRAVRALDARLSHLQTSASLVERNAGSALLAAQGYASAVAEIHAAAQTIEEEVAALLERLRASVATIAEIAHRKGIWVSADWRTPPPLFMPAEAGSSDAPGLSLASDADTFTWSHAAGAWAGALDQIDGACARWRGLVTQRETTERAFVGALERTELLATGPGATAPKSATIAALTVLLSPAKPWEPPAVQRLLGDSLSSVELARLWQQLEADGTDLDELIERYSCELAGIDGLPFSVRDRAARAALDYALSGRVELAHAFARLGLSPDDMSLTDFRRDLLAVRDAVDAATQSAPGADGIVQLAMLGSHDGAVTAAISVGDLDTASRVGVFVSGMNSSVRGMADALPGMRQVQRGVGQSALVTWIGYRAPGAAEEPFQNRAERGSWTLASFLDGITASRSGTPPSRFALLGHSYGTNVAAEALKLGGHAVDAFVSIGSAGLKNGTKSAALGVDEIHATHAEGDNIAPIGQKFHFRETSNGGLGYLPRVDPRDLEGAVTFSSEESPEGKRVTMHNLALPIDWGSAQWAADKLDGVAKVDEVGYLDPESTTVQELINIFGGNR